MATVAASPPSTSAASSSMTQKDPIPKSAATTTTTTVQYKTINMEEMKTGGRCVVAPPSTSFGNCHIHVSDHEQKATTTITTTTTTTVEKVTPIRRRPPRLPTHPDANFPEEDDDDDTMATATSASSSTVSAGGDDIKEDNAEDAQESDGEESNSAGFHHEDDNNRNNNNNNSRSDHGANELISSSSFGYHRRHRKTPRKEPAEHSYGTDLEMEEEEEDEEGHEDEFDQGGKQHDEEVIEYVVEEPEAVVEESQEKEEGVIGEEEHVVEELEDSAEQSVTEESVQHEDDDVESTVEEITAEEEDDGEENNNTSREDLEQEVTGDGENDGDFRDHDNDHDIDQISVLSTASSFLKSYDHSFLSNDRANSINVEDYEKLRNSIMDRLSEGNDVDNNHSLNLSCSGIESVIRQGENDNNNNSNEDDSGDDNKIRHKQRSDSSTSSTEGSDTTPKRTNSNVGDGTKKVDKKGGSGTLNKTVVVVVDSNNVTNSNTTTTSSSRREHVLEKQESASSLMDGFHSISGYEDIQDVINEVVDNHSLNGTHSLNGGDSSSFNDIKFHDSFDADDIDDADFPAEATLNSTPETAMTANDEVKESVTVSNTTTDSGTAQVATTDGTDPVATAVSATDENGNDGTEEQSAKSESSSKDSKMSSKVLSECSNALSSSSSQSEAARAAASEASKSPSSRPAAALFDGGVGAITIHPSKRNEIRNILNSSPTWSQVSSKVGVIGGDNGGIGYSSSKMSLSQSMLVAAEIMAHQCRKKQSIDNGGNGTDQRRKSICASSEPAPQTESNHQSTTGSHGHQGVQQQTGEEHLEKAQFGRCQSESEKVRATDATKAPRTNEEQTLSNCETSFMTSKSAGCTSTNNNGENAEPCGTSSCEEKEQAVSSSLSLSRSQSPSSSPSTHVEREQPQNGNGITPPNSSSCCDASSLAIATTTNTTSLSSSGESITKATAAAAAAATATGTVTASGAETETTMLPTHRNRNRKLKSLKRNRRGGAVDNESSNSQAVESDERAASPSSSDAPVATTADVSTDRKASEKATPPASSSHEEATAASIGGVGEDSVDDVTTDDSATNPDALEGSTETTSDSVDKVTSISRLPFGGKTPRSLTATAASTRGRGGTKKKKRTKTKTPKTKDFPAEAVEDAVETNIDVENGQEGEDFVVEEVLNWAREENPRGRAVPKKCYYLIRWAGYGPEYDTWEPWESLSETVQAIVIEKFFASNKKKKRTQTDNNGSGSKTLAAAPVEDNNTTLVTTCSSKVASPPVPRPFLNDDVVVLYQGHLQAVLTWMDEESQKALAKKRYEPAFTQEQFQTIVDVWNTLIGMQRQKSAGDCDMVEYLIDQFQKGVGERLVLPIIYGQKEQVAKVLSKTKRNDVLKNLQDFVSRHRPCDNASSMNDLIAHDQDVPVAASSSKSSSSSSPSSIPAESKDPAAHAVEVEVEVEETARKTTPSPDKKSRKKRKSVTTGDLSRSVTAKLPSSPSKKSRISKETKQVAVAPAASAADDYNSHDDDVSTNPGVGHAVDRFGLTNTAFANAVDRSESDEDQSMVPYYTLIEKKIMENLVGTIVKRDWEVNGHLQPFTGRVDSGPTKLKRDEPSTWRVSYPDGDTEDIGYDDLVSTIKDNFLAYWKRKYGDIEYDKWPSLSSLFSLYCILGQDSEALTEGQKLIITEHFKTLQGSKISHPLPESDREEDLSLSQVPENLNDHDIQEISEGCASVRSQPAVACSDASSSDDTCQISDRNQDNSIPPERMGRKAPPAVATPEYGQRQDKEPEEGGDKSLTGFGASSVQHAKSNQSCSLQPSEISSSSQHNVSVTAAISDSAHEQSMDGHAAEDEEDGVSFAEGADATDSDERSEGTQNPDETLEFNPDDGAEENDVLESIYDVNRNSETDKNEAISNDDSELPKKAHVKSKVAGIGADVISDPSEGRQEGAKVLETKFIPEHRPVLEAYLSADHHLTIPKQKVNKSCDNVKSTSFPPVRAIVAPRDEWDNLSHLTNVTSPKREYRHDEYESKFNRDFSSQQVGENSNITPAQPKGDECDGYLKAGFPPEQQQRDMDDTGGMDPLPQLAHENSSIAEFFSDPAGGSQPPFKTEDEDEKSRILNQDPMIGPKYRKYKEVQDREDEELENLIQREMEKLHEQLLRERIQQKKRIREVFLNMKKNLDNYGKKYEDSCRRHRQPRLQQGSDSSAAVDSGTDKDGFKKPADRSPPRFHNKEETGGPSSTSAYAVNTKKRKRSEACSIDFGEEESIASTASGRTTKPIRSKSPQPSNPLINALGCFVDPDDQQRHQQDSGSSSLPPSFAGIKAPPPAIQTNLADDDDYEVESLHLSS